MDHVLISSSHERARKWIVSMKEQGYFKAWFTPSRQEAPTKGMVTLPSGREDTIFICTHEERIKGIKAIGQLLRTHNSFDSDALYFHAAAYFRGRRVWDEQTVCWHWGEEDSYIIDYVPEPWPWLKPIAEELRNGR
jgi:hypothetical protein